MTKKNKQHRTVINIMIAVYTLGLLLFLLLALNSCNPVKQVLRDEYKMRKVWNEGVLKNWCVNDTLIINKSDTLITFDTLYSLDFKSDTFTVDKEIVKVKTVVKTVKITDTFTNIVTDNSRIDLLQKERNKAMGLLHQSGVMLDRAKEAVLDARKERNKWRFRFFLLLTIFGLFLFRKPLFKLATKLFSPVKF